MVKIRLSEHLKLRIKVRKISPSLPLKIIKKSKEIYFDKETKHWVAISEEKYAGKIRPMVALFDKTNSDKKEIEARIKKERWIHEKIKN